MTAIQSDLPTLRETAMASKAWPFEEARKVVKRLGDAASGKGYALFETGYGPSGLPHIGTFNEVLRTTMVRNAFHALSDIPTRLIAFSDDMDGLRKVPDNVPNAAMLREHLGKPLTAIPDPFGKFDSFAAHNNAMLREFLDRFGFDYDFRSSTEQYRSGVFDDALRNVLRNYQGIMDIMLPTLRAERAATYSPVLPISPKTGVVLQVPVEVLDADAGLIRFTDADGEVIEHNILSGGAKLQWKVDWAMRWVALEVDYEMYGKDLTDSGIQSGKIARVLGGRKPEGLIYEMFLDEKGEKISKSKGNGLSLEEWLAYGSEESLSFYAYREPKSAKQLHIGVIPRAVDEYEQFRGNYADQPLDKRLGNPVHHVHAARGEAVPVFGSPVSYSLLMNLVGVLGADANFEQVAAYLENYLSPTDHSFIVIAELQNLGTAKSQSPNRIAGLINNALAYHRDFVAPHLKRRAPEVNEAMALRELDAQLGALSDDASAEDVQNIVYAIGKDEAFGFEQLRDWFKTLYQTLLGADQGPRMGSFIALYGIENSRRLIAEALASA